MSDYLRFLVTVDAASGEPVKVEQLGEAGDLAQVDLAAFLRSLGAGSANQQPQIVVNIFGGGAAGVVAAGSSAPQAGRPPMDIQGGPPPPTQIQPPPKPGRRKKPQK